MKSVLILAGFYVPSIKGGGPVLSIRNLVENLQGDLNIYIIANDRDLGDEKPYSNITVNKWIWVEGAFVYYTNVEKITFKNMKKIINETKCNILYLNSFFSFKLSFIPIILNKINLISDMKIIIAPRGGFSEGALGLKGKRKKMIIKLVNILQLYNNVYWHATNEKEKKEILDCFGKKSKIYVANNLTQNYTTRQFSKEVIKQKGFLNLVYISRIHPMKNLLQTIKILSKVDGIIKFDVYGPIEDKDYWRKCQQEAEKLNENIFLNYKGQISNNKVSEVYKTNHVFILLTLGENFGHSITEALIGGCPVIISDQTPWRNLEKEKVGSDLELSNEKAIINTINKYVNMDNFTFENYSKNAFNYAKENLNSERTINEYYTMFEVER